MADPLGLVQGAGRPSLMPSAPTAARDVNSGPAAGFKDVLMQNIEQVNRLQQDAEMAVEDLVAGRRDDAASVLIAKQKADLAFQMLLQVRNKLVAAYDEIKQMRV